MNSAPTETSREEAVALLRWYAEIGVTECLEDAPVDRFAQTEAAREAAASRPSMASQGAPRSAPPAAQAHRQAPTRPVASGLMENAAVPDETAVASARELAAAAGTLEQLREAMAGFEGCNLRFTARNLVFADGNPQAKVMLVGEAPGRDEDEQGLPFVGRSGQLLDRMLAAIGLDRSSVYIANVIAWRPPGNRTPTPQEVEICRPFIERHIELAAPEILVPLGGPATKMLINATAGITQIRGRWTQAEIGGRTIPVLPMLHPAYLLRQPGQKGLAWQDLLKLRQRLDETARER